MLDNATPPFLFHRMNRRYCASYSFIDWNVHNFAYGHISAATLWSIFDDCFSFRFNKPIHLCGFHLCSTQFFSAVVHTLRLYFLCFLRHIVRTACAHIHYVLFNECVDSGTKHTMLWACECVQVYICAVHCIPLCSCCWTRRINTRG